MSDVPLDESPAPPVDDDDEARRTRLRIVTIAVVAVGVLVVGLVVAYLRRDDEPAHAYVELAEPVEMPDVVLTDTDGEAFSLRDDTRGSIALLYFGYLNCPDACPIHMSVLGKTFESLPGNVRDQLDVIFVTTDPDRDDPEAIRDYLDRFDPTFIGLTGSTAELRTAQVAAGVPVAVAEPAGADGEYLVGHATQVLVFDRDGISRRVYPFGVRQSDWAVDLVELVEEQA